MSASKEAVASLINAWNALKKLRSSEDDFATFGHAGLNFSIIGDLFKTWRQAIDALEEKGAWDTNAETLVVDQPLAQTLNEAAALINQGRRNGTAWVFQQGLLLKIMTAQNTLSALVTRRTSINRNIAKLLKEKGESEFDRVLSAASAAKAVSETKEKVESDAAKIRELAFSVTESSNTVSAKQKEVDELANSARAAAAAAQEANAQSTAAQKTIEELKKRAAERESELETRVNALNEKIDTMTREAEEGRRSVELALRKARDQGLAGSFQERSNRIRMERYVWIGAFVVAVALLAITAFTFATSMAQHTYEEFLVHLLKKAAVAAPSVWLGWYSAKQIGRTSRLQEDYEYKAASALAFQSYKDEATLGADPEMAKLLLRHAIETFGENPVRLYEQLSNEANSPLDELLKKVPRQRVLEMLLEAAARAPKT